MLSPAQIMQRLEEIEKDLGERQNDYETAAEDRARLLRDWEKRLAIHMRTAKGPNSEVRKATGLASAIEQDDLYERLTDAEARFEAQRVVIDKVLSARATIGQSLLKGLGRA
jgi:hypothetical protein